jgi:cobalt/nickel transport system permease protein
MTERSDSAAHGNGGAGLLDNLSARGRILAALLLVLAILATREWPGLLAMLGLALGLVVAARRDLAGVMGCLLHAEGFLVLLLLLLPFTTPGAPVAVLGPFTASAEGLGRAVVLALRINACALVVLALVASLEPVRVGHALSSLGVPERLAHLLLLTMRYVAVLRDEMHRLQQAMQARGFVAGSNRHTWRTYGNLTGMMLVRSLDRAERVEEAMRARGFAGRFPISEAEPRGALDVPFLLLALGTGLAALVAPWL